jgi:sulfur relay (sulfurtransferase) DsrC/TusE family protein
MAQIHGISGSTQYLLNGTKAINGKRLATLDELHHLHDHYEEILAETETTVARQQDEIILGLSDDESRFDRQLQEGIAKRTQEVDRDIGELNDKVRIAGNFFTRTGCRLHYWIAVSLRNHRIHSPFSEMIRELHNVQDYKRKHIANRSFIIKNEYNNVVSSYHFLKNNQSFLIGAGGEEFVIGVLSKLPDEYHVVNDVNLHFHRAIHWRERHEYIKNCQIDHIVVGPTGMFLLETKNWKAADIELKSDTLKHQVRRSSLALWYYLKDYYWRDESPKIRNVIISMKGSFSGEKLDKFIDVVSPRQLCGYITAREIALSEDAVKKLIGIITSCKSNYSPYRRSNHFRRPRF